MWTFIEARFLTDQGRQRQHGIQRVRDLVPGLVACLCGVLASAPAPAQAAAPAVEALEPVEAFHPSGPDASGLRSDSAWVIGYQVAMIGILYSLPESISNWSEEQKEEYSLGTWWDNVRNPHWDDDAFWINYIAHPYWGAAYYVRARERGFDERASFWYSVGMSTAFEFGAEALFEQPSIQDLVVTPVGGAIMGEYFMRVRDRTRARYAPGEAMPFLDRALLAVTDPLGAINRQVQSWFGIKVESSFMPQFGPRRVGARPAYADERPVTDWVYGFQVNYRW